MHGRAMKAELTDLQRALACLAHASRFRILIELMERPRFVSELAVAVRLSQSCTTRHLQAMSRVGLVRGARAGRRVVFEVERSTPVLAALAPWTESADGSPPRSFPPGQAEAAEPSTPLKRHPGPNARRSRHRAAPSRDVRARQDARPTDEGTGSDPDSPPAPAAPRRASQEIEDFLL